MVGQKLLNNKLLMENKIISTPLGGVPKSIIREVLACKPFRYDTEAKEWKILYWDIKWEKDVDGKSEFRKGSKTVAFDIMEEQLSKVMEEWRMEDQTVDVWKEVIKRSRPLINSYLASHSLES